MAVMVKLCKATLVTLKLVHINEGYKQLTVKTNCQDFPLNMYRDFGA